MAETTTATTQWLARIHVTLKPVVLDPQGDAVLTGLRQLGFARVSAVRVGKYLEVSVAAVSRDEATEQVRLMCERLLANPVIERYDFDVTSRD
ncbi:MAG: phosphoribosylformylglycinamidine synthase subunit PurS [Ktedonobacterales bacterium]